MSKFKKVFKAIGNVVKKVIDSPIGKIALAAAAIYSGGAALGAWGAGTAATAGGAAASTALGAGATAAGGTAAAAAGTAAATAGGAAAASSGLTVGGFFSGLSTVGKAASAINAVGGLLGSSETQPIGPVGGEASSDDLQATQNAAAAAADEETRRKRRGAGQNILTSPLGISESGMSASQMLLG